MPGGAAASVSKLSPRRLVVVERAFKKFDVDGSGVVDLADMERLYDVSRHPAVVSGSMPASLVREMFLNNFEDVKTRDGKVTWAEFQNYYLKMSAEVDRGREIDKDAFFELIVTRAWRLDEDALPVVPSTGLRLQSLEMCEGFAASVPLDLVWKDAASGRLVGYRGVVKNVFARKCLPECLRGHMALQPESVEQGVTYLQPPTGCLLPPYDLIWSTAADGSTAPAGSSAGTTSASTLRGLAGVVLSKVDLPSVPEPLRSYIFPAAKAKLLRNVNYLPVREGFNPVYKKTSHAIGIGATEQAEATCRMKAAYYSGNGCGQVYCGRVGKFTDTFQGGPYTNSSLNVTRKSVAATFS